MAKVTATVSSMPSACQAHCWPLHIQSLSDTQEVAPHCPDKELGQFRPTEAGGCDAQVTAKPTVLAGRAFQAGPGNNFTLLPHQDT